MYIFAMMRTDIMRKARPLGSHMRADETFICQTCLWGQMRELQGGLSRIRIHEEAASRLVVEWNASEWQKVQDPESAVGFRLWIATHWWHAEHMLCVWSAPIPIRTKLELWAFITGKITVRLRRKLALRSP